ncbi:MAG TPA: hypothetical protein P5534_00290 [Candidatus Paceibacterota bacterium]|nr:hypothetical protein [Candidatus Paceibacterota bacterium]
MPREAWAAQTAVTFVAQPTGEDDPEEANVLRESIVAPAQRAESAARKARCKEAPEGYPVHSIASL